MCVWDAVGHGVAVWPSHTTCWKHNAVLKRLTLISSHLSVSHTSPPPYCNFYTFHDFIPADLWDNAAHITVSTTMQSQPELTHGLKSEPDFSLRRSALNLEILNPSVNFTKIKKKIQSQNVRIMLLRVLWAKY